MRRLIAGEYKLEAPSVCRPNNRAHDRGASRRCNALVVVVLLLIGVAVLCMTSLIRTMSQRDIKGTTLQELEGASNTSLALKRMASGECVAEFVERLLNPKTFFVVPPEFDPALGRSRGPHRLFLDLRKLPTHLRRSLEADEPDALSECIDAAFQKITALGSAPQPTTQALQSDVINALEETLKVRGDAPTTLAECHLSTLLAGLDLGANGLTSLTPSLLRFTSLEVLFLTDNLLSEIPPFLSQMSRLNRLSLKANLLTAVDPLRQLPHSLMHLIMTENNISEFLSGFADVVEENGRDVGFFKLRKLMLAGNKISNWSQVLSTHGGARSASMSALELLRLSRNQITMDAFDSTASTMIRGCTKLCWLSFAGNPFVDPSMSTDERLAHVLKKLSHLPDLTSAMDCRERDAEPGEIRVLGQGASGVVKRCLLRKENGHRDPVAVKFFKRVSSDGSGSDEILALADVPSDHPYIVAPIGYIRYPTMEYIVAEGILPSAVPHHDMYRFALSGNEDGDVIAVCFPLIHAEPLAKPPTIWTVSDDIFPPPRASLLGQFVAAYDTADQLTNASKRDALLLLTVNVVIVKFLLSISSAMGALHASGVQLVHGDLYAHNAFFGQMERTVGSVGDDHPSKKAVVELHQSIEHLLGKNSLSLFWTSRDVLLTDFGASFSYADASIPTALKESLEGGEVLSFLVFARDVIESLLPLSAVPFSSQQGEEPSSDRFHVDRVSGVLYSMRSAVKALAGHPEESVVAGCRDVTSEVLELLVWMFSSERTPATFNFQVIESRLAALSRSVASRILAIVP